MKPKIKIIVGMVVLLFVYMVLLWFLNSAEPCLDPNEFGDYVGGILNPLFQLLSTSAIIWLTYVLAKNESKKTDEAIISQRVLTLNQMRQDALKNLTTKLDMFIYQDQLSVSNVKQGTLVQQVITKNIEEKGIQSPAVWLFVLYELNSFKQLNYLFGDLFKRHSFEEKYEQMESVVNRLIDEQKLMKLITPASLENYLSAKQELVIIIGDYILSEFSPQAGSST